MKTPTKPTAPRMPRASKTLPAVVRWLYLGNDLHTCISPTRLNDGGKEQVCAVIPTATAQQARKLAAFWNLTEEQRVEAIGNAIWPGQNIKSQLDAEERGFQPRISHILAAITGGRTD